MRRSRRVLRDGATEWSCDLDVGEVRTATASAPICELELELRRGDPARLYDLALELLDSAALRPGTQSKADLGYALLTGVRPGPRKAGPIVHDESPTLEVLIEAVVRSCLDQIASNALPACDGDDPEGVHQMRVGVRRLRSALSVFDTVLPALHLERLRTELKWLGGELGEARDLDVFSEEFLEPVFRVRCQDPALKRLRDEAAAMRREAQDRVRLAIRSPRYTRLLLDLGRWLARAEWRDQPQSASRALLFQPAQGFARKRLAKHRRRARRLGRNLAEAPIETKHRGAPLPLAALEAAGFPRPHERRRHRGAAAVPHPRASRRREDARPRAGCRLRRGLGGARRGPRGSPAAEALERLRARPSVLEDALKRRRAVAVPWVRHRPLSLRNRLFLAARGRVGGAPLREHARHAREEWLG
jgi:inorganic triphosphatase YgiF